MLESENLGAIRAWAVLDAGTDLPSMLGTLVGLLESRLPRVQHGPPLIER